MTEAEALKTAQALVTAGRKKEALPLRWTLCDSADLNVKLQAGLALVASLDRLTESDKLLKVVDDILPVASALGDADVHTYLLGKKAEFLSNRLSSLIFQQRSLNLASAVFEWIDFSLEEDKAEFAKIAAQRTALQKRDFPFGRTGPQSGEDWRQSLHAWAYFQCAGRGVFLSVSGQQPGPCASSTAENNHHEFVSYPSLAPRQADRLQQKGSPATAKPLEQLCGVLQEGDCGVSGHQ
jgi:hypothetical protein